MWWSHFPGPICHCFLGLILVLPLLWLCCIFHCPCLLGLGRVNFYFPFVLCFFLYFLNSSSRFSSLDINSYCCARISALSAKAALTSSLAAHSQVCWSDLKPQVDTYICTAWQALWNDETRNKLYEIRPNLKESLCNTTQPLYRKQETVMTRLRIGHTWITHSYLLKKEDQPFCHACDNPFTVKHILVECSDFTHTRNKYYTTTDVHTLFREVNSSKIIEFLKEIKLFDKI